MKYVFISYTQADRAWADWIAWQLEDAGQPVRYQGRDFREGASFMASMQQAVTEATATVAVLSPDYLASPFCTAEWTAVLAGDPTNAAGRLIPVRVAGSPPSGLLAPLAFVDLMDSDEAAAAQRLRAAVAASPAVRAAAGGAALPAPKRRPRPWFPPQRTRQLAWRVAAAAAGGVALATGVWEYLARWFPRWMAQAPTALGATAVVCGLLGAVAVYALLRRGASPRRLTGDPT